MEAEAELVILPVDDPDLCEYNNTTATFMEISVAVPTKRMSAPDPSYPRKRVSSSLVEVR